MKTAKQVYIPKSQSPQPHTSTCFHLRKKHGEPFLLTLSSFVTLPLLVPEQWDCCEELLFQDERMVC